MPKRGEMHESAWFAVDVDDETGVPFWRGGGADDKDETRFEGGEPLVLNPNHFPPGSRVTLDEPWDEAFYDRLYRHHGTASQRFLVWASQAVEEWDGQDNADLLELLARKFGIDIEELVRQGRDRVEGNRSGVRTDGRQGRDR
jgi:hypothetical protein